MCAAEERTRRRYEKLKRAGEVESQVAPAEEGGKNDLHEEESPAVAIYLADHHSPPESDTNFSSVVKKYL